MDLEIKVCQGCSTCYHTGTCFIKDDSEKLVHMISESDGIIIGSPTYASNVSGLLKVFIDRGHFVIEQALYGKYAMSVATSENYGSKDTSQVLNKLLTYSGAKLCSKIIQNLPFGSDFNSHSKLLKRLENEIEKFYDSVRHNRVYIWQSFVHKIIFSIGIKNFVLKKGNAYTGVIDKWKKFGII